MSSEEYEVERIVDHKILKDNKKVGIIEKIQVIES